MHRKVMVPLDGSELAEKALLYAREPAARRGEKIIWYLVKLLKSA